MRRSSNAGSCNCTRTASPRARSGRSATSRVPPCTGGCGGPQQRFDQGGRQPHAGAERADRVEGAQPPVGDGDGCFRTSGAGIRTKAEAIRSDAGRCPISAQCRILGVAKSTYCWMLGHPETERADPHEEDVGRVWRDSGKIYGGRKIKHAPGHEGIVMSRRRVNRIMKAGGMAGSYSRARYRPHPAKPNDGPAPNLSARGFDGCKPRTHLAADPAYVRAGNSWAYICLPGDLANREIAGHSVGVRHDPDLVPAAFAMLRFPSGDIEVLHTDRGGGFTGERIERMLDVFGITRFLSNPGSPYDDAVVESTNRLIRRSSYTPTRTRAWNNCARTPTGTYGGTTTSGSTRPSDT